MIQTSAAYIFVISRTTSIKPISLSTNMQQGFTAVLSDVAKPSETERSLTHSLSTSLKKADDWDPVFYVDGLVMLRYNTATLDLVLWNPSIHKARALPLPPAISQYKNIDLGFGLVQDGETNLRSIAVYTVGTGSWKTIQFQDAKCSSWHWSFHGYARSNVCCKGILYSLPKNMNSDTQELVSFDLSSDVFDSKSLPPIDVRVIHRACLRVDGDGSLTWLNYSGAASSIWVLEGSGNDMDSRYWTKRYKLDIGICRGYLYLKNGKMLLQWYNRVSSYDLETEEETILAAVPRNLRVGNVCGCVESLLLLDELSVFTRNIAIQFVTIWMFTFLALWTCI